MSSAFVPFLKSGKTSTAPTGDSAAASGTFTAVVTNAAAASPATGCVHPKTDPAAAPVVTLKKDGDRVTHIHIQCACGQVVELECAY